MYIHQMVFKIKYKSTESYRSLRRMFNLSLHLITGRDGRQKYLNRLKVLEHPSCPSPGGSGGTMVLGTCKPLSASY